MRRSMRWSSSSNWPCASSRRLALFRFWVFPTLRRSVSVDDFPTRFGQIQIQICSIRRVSSSTCSPYGPFCQSTSILFRPLLAGFHHRGRFTPSPLRPPWHWWTLARHKSPLFWWCSRWLTHPFVRYCWALTGAATFGPWYLRRKSFLDFPRPPSASLHPECSPASGLAHKMQSSTRLYLLLAPTPENPCVSNLALFRFLHGCNSSNHARPGTSASCTPKTHCCFRPTFLLEEHHQFLFPFPLPFCIRSRTTFVCVEKRERILNPRALIPCKYWDAKVKQTEPAQRVSNKKHRVMERIENTLYAGEREREQKMKT
mgnify:CR=1 FL=1